MSPPTPLQNATTANSSGFDDHRAGDTCENVQQSGGFMKIACTGGALHHLQLQQALVHASSATLYAHAQQHLTQADSTLFEDDTGTAKDVASAAPASGSLPESSARTADGHSLTQKQVSQRVPEEPQAAAAMAMSDLNTSILYAEAEKILEHLQVRR